MIANGFGTGQVLWDMVWFFLFVISIWLLITVFVDTFRSRDLGASVASLTSRPRGSSTRPGMIER